MADVCINLPSLKALFQVLVNRFIGDFAEQRQIRDSDFLLLGYLKSRFLDLSLAARITFALPAREE